MRPILFGDYAWNTVKVDWAEPGAWMTHGERVKSGARLGDRYEVPGVERAKDWSDVVALFEYSERNIGTGASGANPRNIVQPGMGDAAK